MSRVLLVEDTVIYQKTIALALKKLGHTVTIAENGQKALEILQSGQRFDVALVDYQMPEMNGRTLTRLIRTHTNPNIAKLPLVATSNRLNHEEESCIVLFKEGCDSICAKDNKFNKRLEQALEVAMSTPHQNIPDSRSFSPWRAHAGQSNVSARQERPAAIIKPKTSLDSQSFADKVAAFEKFSEKKPSIPASSSRG